jgi:lipooligosaccharide transport system permease protein
MPEALAVARGSLALWRRHALVWRQMFWSSMATNVANPLLFLFAFGFGLGAAIPRMAGMDYLAFVVPGMMAYSAMFSASFEGTISAFTRFHQQRTWDAILATPVSLLELLVGEVLWAATKAMISATCVLAVGWLWGGVPSPAGGLLALLILFVASLGFAVHALTATAFAKSYEFFSYYFTFWITPMFVFSGVFFAIDRFPGFVQVVSWVLPMTHLIAVIRPLTAGTELGLGAAALHLGYLVLLSAVAFAVAYRRIAARLFD